MDVATIIQFLRDATHALDRALFQPADDPDSVPPVPADELARVEAQLGPDLPWAALEERLHDPKLGRGVPRLLLVILGERAFRAGRFAEAQRHALQALAREQRDLLAQGIYLKARHALGEGPPAVDLAGRFCAKPFRELELRPDLGGHACCPSWLAVPIGRADGASGAAFWNSAAAKALRRSVLDGSFTWCSRLHCPHIAAGTLPRRDDVREPLLAQILAEGRTEVEQGPARVLLNYDRSCNLACPSCRRERIVADQAERTRLDEVADRVVLPLLADARTVKLTGSGDPFASAHFRRLLKQLDRRRYPRLRLQLQTNGLLLDERAWRELDLDGRVAALWVSIDAASAETYAAIRRGGDWQRLLANLDFMARMRREGRIEQFRVDFVAQAGNYLELPDACRLARQLGADGFFVQLIRNWGTFTPDAFQRHQIGAPDHPEHARFLEVLRDPVLGWPGVDWSNLKPLRDRALAPPRELAPAS